MSDSWTMLLDAHDRANPDVGGIAPVHRPTAAVLACSDARVPPSVVFDQDAGSLFVVRVAGNTASDPVLASLDYAVQQLGVDLVVVLGHTECGAVRAALDGSCAGTFGAVTAPICAVAAGHPSADPDEIVARNVEATLRVLREHPGPTGDGIRHGRVQLRGAVHDLRSGRLLDLSSPTNNRTSES